MTIQSLEPRRLLSVTTDTDGTIHIVGTGLADRVTIDFDIVVNGVQYNMNSSKGYRVDLMGGSDRLTVGGPLSRCAAPDPGIDLGARTTFPRVTDRRHRPPTPARRPRKSLRLLRLGNKPKRKPFYAVLAQ